MNTRAGQGFTLLEILVALTILGLLSLVVLTGLQVSSRAWQSGQVAVEQQQRFRVLFDRLFSEMKSAYSLRVRTENKIRLAFIGTADRLEFVSTGDTVTSLNTPTGLKRLAIYVASGGGSDGLQGLVMRESLIDYGDDFFSEEDTEDDIGIEYNVAPDVTDIKFRYFYYPTLRTMNRENEEEGEWADSWGGLNEEMIFEGDMPEEFTEEDQDMLEYLRYSSINLPVGIEVTITWLDIDGTQVTLPPVYVALQESAVMSMQGN